MTLHQIKHLDQLEQSSNKASNHPVLPLSQFYKNMYIKSFCFVKSHYSQSYLLVGSLLFQRPPLYVCICVLYLCGILSSCVSCEGQVRSKINANQFLIPLLILLNEFSKNSNLSRMMCSIVLYIHVKNEKNR